MTTTLASKGSRIFAALVTATMLGAMTVVAAPPVTAHPRARTYIVRARPGQIGTASARLRDLGVHVSHELRSIDEAVVRMSPGTVARAARLATVASITADAAVRLASDNWDGGGNTGDTGNSGDTAYDPTADPNSMYTIAGEIGARDAWQSTTGHGVDVALLDSGVAPVAGLDAPGKVVYGPDLSFESQNANLRNLDTYGHGTHMAGIIAGHDAGADPRNLDPTSFLGIAPDARIVSVKLADAYGATDVSQVIAGIDWVVQHAHDNGFNIRVINLSFGTPSLQPAAVDPLSYAAEAAWHHGIVVVVSAGNSGTRAGRLSDPAIDPWVIAVGADDANGTRATWDDSIPSYSSRGDGTRNPDLVAPGAHVQSLRAPGSNIDDLYGAGPGSITDRFLRGSGTSQAAAVVSGSVALLLQQRPDLTPDQVKALLTHDAHPLAGTPETAQGAGLVNLRRALDDDVPDTLQSDSLAPSTGTGSLEGARGGQNLERDGVALTGETDIFGAPFDSTAHATAEDAATSWHGGTWNGRRWAGDSWTGDTWTTTSWQTATWDTHTWAGTAWTSGQWDDASWTGRRWADATWAGRRWAGSQWSMSNFDGGNWSVSQWN